MRLTVTARSRLDPDLRTYAVEKLTKLERLNGRIHEVRVVLEDDDRRIPRASAEVFVHLRHTQVIARCDGVSLREAIDKVADKVDRQVLRLKDKITDHKGRPAAGSDPHMPAPRHVEPAAGITPAAVATPTAADPVASRRSVLLRPMSVEDAVAAFERHSEPFMLFLDDEEGDLCVLTRRSDGEVELVVGDTR